MMITRKELSPRCFRSSPYKGSIVEVSVPDQDGKSLVVFFQTLITRPHVKDGKLVPCVFTDIKRKGGKRRMAFTLTLEGAESLYKVLGMAIKDARAKKNSDEAYHILLSSITNLRHSA